MTSKNKFVGYRCSICGKEYPPEDFRYTCDRDGGNLDVILDYQRIKLNLSENLVNMQEHSIWRYLPLIPTTDPGGDLTPVKSVGWTPVYEPKGLSEKLGLERLYIKDEGKNPTASFKDRASVVVAARAQDIGAEVIVTASTGNAGAALAGMCAAMDTQAVIFAPKSAPPAKIAQLLIYGADVYLVDGNYDQAFDLSLEASNEFGWYCRNTGYNPFTAEGKKTAAFEIWEFIKNLSLKKISMDQWNVFVSVGDGNIISGIHKGFKDLNELGWIDGTPKIFGVQSVGSSAIYNAYTSGTEHIEAVAADTLADSISVDMPRDGLRALRAATQTGGAYIQVTDDQILQAISDLGSVGIFGEPAGVTSYAGVRQAIAQGLIDEKDPVMAVMTGSGLKDVNAAMSAVSSAPVIEPSLQALKQLL